jgi:hypothetical protein
VLSELKSKDNETTTTTAFDETLRQLKDDPNPNALNNHIVNLLETQINGNLKDEIVYYRKIQALIPIIYILFNDRTKVEIFVQIKTNDKHSQVDSNFHESVAGVRQNNRSLQQFL